MTTCDVCGKEEVIQDLEPLKDCYQTDDIKEVCSKCIRELNSKLAEIRNLTQQLNKSWLKRFMNNMKEKI